VVTVDLEVVELLDDLLARLAREELRVLHHRRVDFLEAEAPGHGPEVAEEPVAQAQILGIEVPRPLRRALPDPLDLGAHAGIDTGIRCRPPAGLLHPYSPSPCSWRIRA